MNESLECLPCTQFFAIYMQISTFLTITLYGLYFKNVYIQFITAFTNITIILLWLIYRIFYVNQLYLTMSMSQNPTSNILNPAKNYLYYCDIYLMPFDHYLSFILLGSFSGYLFFYYNLKKIAQNSI